MDFLNSLTKTNATSPKNDNTKNENTKNENSISTLLSSAKVVGEAAQTTLSREPGQSVDKVKVAKAGEDLLDGADHYGKLKEKGYGDYVDKAETYLHQYSSTTTTTTTKTDSEHPATTTTTTIDKTTAGSTKLPSSEEGGEDKSGGSGGYLKMAEGFLKK